MNRRKRVIQAATYSITNCHFETEVERLCRIGRERQDLRARVRAEILGQVPAWGMSPFEAGDLLEQLGQMIKANAEAMRRASRGGR